MSQTNYSRYKYTPDEIDEQEFLASFVIRNHDFDDIFDDIKQTDYKVPSQHHIIIGQRGQGKTTLLRKVMLEVESDSNLSPFLLPIKFSEEQYQIRSLCRLWEEVADYLQNVYEAEFPDIMNDMEGHFDDDDYTEKSFSHLEQLVKLKNKKLLLLIDNIDELLGKLKIKEQRRLREILLTSSTFKIIGGSTKMLEQHYDYGKPFYEFFKINKLIGLNKQECFDFLVSIGDEQQQLKIATIIKDTPERIETLRRLTGGVPRTLIMLFDIFIDDGGNSFDDLLKVLDDATPLYKHRMDDLPDTLQDITHSIAMNWDGITTKDIAKKTRLESKVVSAQLNQLEAKYGIIESTSIGKNKIYKIEERFFNIWYLMRFGRKKDRQKVEWLVNFLTSWCSKTELERRANQFIDSVKNGKMKESYVYHMCEALSYAGLDMKIEHKMKQETKTYLLELKSKYASDLAQSDQDLLKKAFQLFDDKNTDKAINLLVSSQKSSPYILSYIGYLYHQQKQLIEAEDFYLKGINSGDNYALINLGHLYDEKNEFEKAEEYYLKSIESGDNNALVDLARLYDTQENFAKAEDYYIKATHIGNDDASFALGNFYYRQNQFDKSEKYYLKALDSGVNDTLYNLGNLYLTQRKYDKAEEYFLRALDSGDNDTLSNLGNLYSQQNQFDKAEEYYLKAIDNGNKDVFNNIGNLYSRNEQFDKAEIYYLKAIEVGNKNALYNLGNLYYQQEQLEKAEEYYLKSLDDGDNDALVSLGNIKVQTGQFEEAEEFYLKGIDNADNDSLFFLADLYTTQGKFDKAEEYLLKSLDVGDEDALFFLANLYEKQEKFDKAELYYQKAIDIGDDDALLSLAGLFDYQDNIDRAEEYYIKAIDSKVKSEESIKNILAWFYFQRGKKGIKALELTTSDYEHDQNFFNTHTYAVILLWNENVSLSYEKFIQWLDYKSDELNNNDVMIYLTLLIAKNQYYKAKELMEIPKYQLKDKYKPIWYALMTLIQDKYPHEIKRMGNELQESVDEVLQKIEETRQKYKLS